MLVFVDNGFTWKSDRYVNIITWWNNRFIHVLDVTKFQIVFPVFGFV